MERNAGGVRGLSLCAVIGLALFAGVACGENLVHNGDFELPSPESPPPGWTMWGAEAYKMPANYTRDTANPKEGEACFRIHHPAGTAGYIVSSPDHAIRPRKGMMYTVAFWARTDRPGPSAFGFTAYETISPFVDAPSPGWFTIEVGRNWTEFTFEVHEGWDFFFDRSRFLLLTFKTTVSQEEEKTLWIDEVEVAEQMSPREGRLIDEAKLEYAPLQHRLRPGQQLEFTVDARKRLRRATHDVGGVSFHRVAGWTGQPYNKQGEYTLLPELEEAIRQMRLPMTRFYAVGDEPFDLEAAIDRAAELCRRIGVPLDHVPLEFEIQSARTKLAPQVWARGVEHSLRKGYAFRHWEVGNEPYAAVWGIQTAFPSPDDYVAHFKAVSAAIREVHPQAHVGVAIHSHNQKWGNYVLKRAAGSYDFVVGHYYASLRVHEAKFEDVALTENFKVLDRILQVDALIRACNPGRELYQYDTEWGLHSMGPDGERADNVDRNANIFGTMHRAVRLIYYAREDILRGASSWQMLNRVGAQGFGILAQEVPEKRFMLYWLYYYFNRHVGEWVLDVDGTAPYYTPAASGHPKELAGPLTPALVTLSAGGGDIYLVIANGSWDREVPCRVALRNFQPVSATGVLLSHSDPDGKPLLERKEDAISDLTVGLDDQLLTCVIPPHSVVFITIVGEGAE